MSPLRQVSKFRHAAVAEAHDYTGGAAGFGSIPAAGTHLLSGPERALGPSMNSTGSSFLVASFLAMPLALLALWVWLLARVTVAGVRMRDASRAVLAASAWLVSWSLLGASGVLDVWDGFPPRVALMIPVLFAVSVGLARSDLGQRFASKLSLRTLVGLQAFRLPLELLMYRAALEGLMPMQMSLAGYNFDVITGSVALTLWAVALVRKRELPSWIGWGFSVLGLGTLTVILAIALASMPMFALFGPERLNTWVTRFPYVLLPAVMVQVALFWHLVLLRKLALSRKSSGSGTSALVHQRQRA
jgi:hypothetical protein